VAPSRAVREQEHDVSETLDRILAEDYLGDLSALGIDEVRSRRAECKDVETGLSYLRRLVQGRLDVVAAEVARRAEGGDAADLEDLIARLPELLAASTRSPGTGRLPESIGTGSVDPGLAGELDEIISHGRLTDVSEVGDAELDAAQAELAEFEHKVSGLRRALFDRIDALEAELTRRYRTGEATVDSLLT
jgi:hypothetical protein